MGFTAGEYAHDSLTLTAPLVLNLNDKQTAFGGTLATLCTISGWTMVSMDCREAGFNIDIVVTESQIRYVAPVRTEQICARAFRPDEALVAAFCDALGTKGSGALAISVNVDGDKPQAVMFHGHYFARLIEA